MVAPIETNQKRYDASSNDWVFWGSSREQACRNKRTYDQYLECGYKEEPKFDEYGWCKNEVPKEQIEVIRIFGEEPLVSTVECLQLPNGKWISGIHYTLSLSGCSCGCSIWSKQYDKRINALLSRLRPLVDTLKVSRIAKDREYIKDVIRVLDDLRQLSLF